MADKTAIIKSAQKFLAKGQIDKAIAEWEKLASSADANTFNTIGDLYMRKGDPGKAIENFHKAARVFRDEGFSLKGLAIYKKILNVKPTEADALYALGELNEEKGIVTDAIRYYLASADILASENAKDKLPRVYEKIVGLAADNISLRIKIAELFSKEAFVAEAAKEYVEIAKLYKEKGDTGKAEDYFKKAYDIHPNNKGVLLGLSGLYESGGRFDKAMEFIAAAEERLGEDLELVIYGAKILSRMGSFDQAVERAVRAINMEPDGIEAKKLLGDIYRESGDMQKAWETYKKVLDEIIFKEMYEEAVGILNDFREIDPVETSKKLVALHNKTEDTEAAFTELMTLGDYFFNKGMMQDAMNTFKEAAQMKPGDGEVAGRLGEIEKALGVEAPKAEEKGGTEEKPVEELLAEADIFIRYGLRSEAEKLLESIKVRVPENTAVHEKLKAVYVDSKNTELAVTECIILAELYARAGEGDKRTAVVKEALGLNPEDPRLIDKFSEEFSAEMQGAAKAAAIDLGVNIVETPAEEPVSAPAEEPVSAPAEEPVSAPAEEPVSAPAEEFVTEPPAPPPAAAAPEEAPGLDSFDDEMAEADFYVKEGLYKDAAEILRGLSAKFPDEAGLRGKLAEVEKLVEEELVAAEEKKQTAAAAAEASAIAAATAFDEKKLEEKEDGEDFETISLSDITESLEDALEVQETSDPVLEDDVLGIFNEFKKGLEKELDDEDMETRYNLGIAYKEMGLIDDAINEFQTAMKDPDFELQSQSMLGICYGAKGLHSLAIGAFQKTIAKMEPGDEAFWGMKFELAEAYEKNGDIRKAFDIYTGVYGFDSMFRGVANKINSLKPEIDRISKGSGEVAEVVADATAEVDETETITIDLEEEDKAPAKKPPGGGKAPKSKKSRVFYI